MRREELGPRPRRREPQPLPGHQHASAGASARPRSGTGAASRVRWSRAVAYARTPLGLALLHGGETPRTDAPPPR
ncbi:hypothetical protein ACPCDX_02355 [Streptomyces koyangensis]|uniref:hypothetical protein n=1 Tax=Streptomyces koyangensis TaxID=188770 RepID=UPI003C2F98A8